MNIARKVIFIRRDTEARWRETDPIIGKEEPVTTIGSDMILKIGDGVHRWSELPQATPQEAYDFLVASQPKGN